MSTIDDLYAVLEQERAFLRTGAIDQLTSLQSRKEALTARLLETGSALGREVVEDLRHQLERNARMLKSAQDGVQSAADRLRERQRVATTLETYSADGRRQEFMGPKPRHSRRA